MANSFTDALSKPGPAAQSAISDKISALSRVNTKTKGVLNSDGTIAQTERLFTARARYGKDQYNTAEGQDLGGSRGQWAYIKLMTSQTQYAQYVNGSTSREVTYKGLIGSGSDVAMMSDPNGQKTIGYDKFLLTGVSCDMSEKVQITEVFGDNEVVYYFGRQPMVFNFRGVLIDSPDNSWFTDWLQLYSDFLRGSQLAKNYELLKIVLPNMAVTGTISGFSWNQDSNRDTDIPFSFQFIAKIVEPIAATPAGMPTSNNVQYVDFSQVSKFVSQASINSLKGQVSNAASVIQSPTSSLRQKGAALSTIGTGVGGTFGSMLESGKDSINSFQKKIEGWTTSENSFFNEVKSSAMFQTVTSSLNGIRTNLFSPIYGVLSSLTKLVTNTFNSAKSIFNAVIQPVRNILRDITNISKKAIALVNLVNTSITGFGRYVTGQLKGVSNDYKTAIKTLGKASGTIATSPATVAHSIATMFSSGALANDTPFLKTSPKLSFAKPTLSIVASKPVTKAALLSGITGYNVATSNKL